MSTYEDLRVLKSTFFFCLDSWVLVDGGMVVCIVGVKL